MTSLTIAPMTLGDIFDRLFKLIGKTWIRNLILTSTILVIPVIILSLGMDAFFSSIAAMAKHIEPGNESAPEELLAMLGPMVWFFLSILLFSFGSAASTLSITIVGCAEMSGEPMAWQEAMRRGFGIRLVRMIGLYIIQGATSMVLLLVPYVLIFVAIAIRSWALGLLAGFLFLACIPLVIFLLVRWAFAIPAIGWENLEIISSLRRSWTLVRKNGWRVLGILILMSVILSFAVSLIMTPVYVLALWKLFAFFFNAIGSSGSEQTDPSVFLEGLRSFGFVLGLLSGLGSLLRLLVAPLYTVVLYFDLRARNNEFGPTSPVGAQLLP